MAKISVPLNDNYIADLVYKAREAAQDESHRYHLGCSVLGDDCDRKIWYGFRWVSRPHHKGRLLRLFLRGQREEEVFVQDLKLIGCNVQDIDPATKLQYAVKAVGGHLGGSMDGQATDIPGADKTRHILEFKTHGKSSFSKLVSEGVEKSKPAHYVQMQMYMGLGKLTRALFTPSVCA